MAEIKRYFPTTSNDKTHAGVQPILKDLQLITPLNAHPLAVFPLQKKIPGRHIYSF